MKKVTNRSGWQFIALLSMAPEGPGKNKVGISLDQ